MFVWWRRNISRKGFAINGYVKHYPDIMTMTESGKIILAETKGEHLKNDDSRDKIALGQAWKAAAGNMYRYYMKMSRTVQSNLPKDFGKRVSGENHFLKGSLLTD